MATENGKHHHQQQQLEPMEVEELHPRPSASSSRLSSRPPPQHILDQLCTLLKLYMEYYPKITALLLFALVFFAMHILVESFRTPIQRNRVSHDYSRIDNDYNFKLSQIDHWCLFGGDDDCPNCEDFTEPNSREAMKGWMAAHKANTELVKMSIRERDYDVVFLGDETTEAWNGKRKNLKLLPDGQRIQEYWNKTFTKEGGGGTFEGLALGIDGDSTANLLWRIQHGEIMPSIKTKVWWILIGTNDLARGECSEEVVVLGILRTAEEIHHHYPDDVIVIQGILPRSNRPDGSITPTKSGHHFFGGRNKVYTPEMARKELLLWPSIVDINKELEDFCSQHEHMVYFDASNLFLGSMGNKYYRQERKEIVKDLMPDYVHLSYQGHKVLGDAIVRELNRIIYDEEESNDVEEGVEGR